MAEGMQRRTLTVNVLGSNVRYQPKPTELDMRYPELEVARSA